MGNNLHNTDLITQICLYNQRLQRQEVWEPIVRVFGQGTLSTPRIKDAHKCAKQKRLAAKVTTRILFPQYPENVTDFESCQIQECGKCTVCPKLFQGFAISEIFTPKLTYLQTFLQAKTFMTSRWDSRCLAIDAL